MKKIIITLSVGLILSLGLSSCKKDDPITEETTQLGANEIPSSTLDLGSQVSTQFVGQVKDEFGQPLEGVEIRVGASTVSTDENGTYELSTSQVPEMLACLELKKNGYFNTIYSVRPSNGAYTLADVKMASSHVGTYSVSQTTVFSEGNGLVEMSEVLVDVNGNVYTDQAHLNMRFFATDDASISFPGSNFAQDEGGNAGVIKSYGAVGVELTGASGQELQLAQGTTALIELELEPNQLSGAPATIPMWFLDESTGYWIQEGSATLTNGKYVGEVGHFTFWTFGTFADWALFHGQIEDNLGASMTYVNTTLTVNAGTTTGQSNFQGSFTSYVPANEVIAVDIEDQCQNPALSVNVGPYTSGSTAVETFVVTPGTGYHQIVGQVNDCFGNPITYGWIHVQAGQNTNSYFLFGGVLNLYHNACANPATGNFLLTDLNSGNQQSLTNVPSVNQIFDLGTVTTCPGPAEYLTYTLDGTPYPIDVPFYCVVADSFGTGISISVEWAESVAPNAILYIQGSDDQLGPQPYSPDPSAVPGYKVQTTIQPYWGSTQNMSFNLTAFPASIGDYFDLTGTGTYTDFQSNVHTLDIDLHVIRDI